GRDARTLVAGWTGPGACPRQRASSVAEHREPLLSGLRTEHEVHARGLAHRCGWLHGIEGSRKEDGVVGHLRQLLRDALVQGEWIAAGTVHATATLEEQRVARNEATVDVEALTAGRVPGCVDELDRDVTDRHRVARCVLDEIGCRRASDTH